MTLAVSVILLMTILVTLLSGRLERWMVTVPMAMVLAGILVGWQTSLPIIDNMDEPAAERGVEIVLALLLFLDATEVKQIRRRSTGLLVRFVALGVPLCLFVTTIAASMTFPHERLAFCLVLACIMVPTDMAPAARIVSDGRIPPAPSQPPQHRERLQRRHRGADLPLRHRVPRAQGRLRRW